MPRPGQTSRGNQLLSEPPALPEGAGTSPFPGLPVPSPAGGMFVPRCPSVPVVARQGLSRGVPWGPPAPPAAGGGSVPRERIRAAPRARGQLLLPRAAPKQKLSCKSQSRPPQTQPRAAAVLGAKNATVKWENLCRWQLQPPPPEPEFGWYQTGLFVLQVPRRLYTTGMQGNAAGQ